MKKILSLIVFLFAIVLLVGCGGGDNSPSPTKLTSKEKFELIQEMESPNLKVFQMLVELKGSVIVNDLAMDVDAKIDTYTDLSVRTNIYNYTTMDLKLLSPQNNMEVKGSIYTNLSGAYLDLNGHYTIGGTKVSVEGKEVMDLTPFTDGEIPQEIYDELFEMFPWDDFQDQKYDELKDEYLDQMLEFITVYQDKNKTTLNVSITKAKILEIADLNGSGTEMGDFIEKVSDDSKIEFSVVFVDKKLTKMSLSAVFKMVYEDSDIDVSGKIEFVLNGKAPTLPTSTQLASYREVELFTILAPILGNPGTAEPTFLE